LFAGLFDTPPRVEKLGATTVVLMNISGADPMGAIATYRDHVLPAVRGAERRMDATKPS
jgi:hypothetical protein